MCKNLLLEIEWDTILSSGTGDKILILILNIDAIQSFIAMYHTLRNHNNLIVLPETEIQVLASLVPSSEGVGVRIIVVCGREVRKIKIFYYVISKMY